MELKGLLDERGLTPKSLAQLAGIHANTVYHVIWDGHVNSFGVAKKICQALQIELNEVDEFANIERPGDLCDCQCGGYKTEAVGENSLRLVIAVPCQVCLEVRHFGQGKPHPNLCYKHSRRLYDCPIEHPDFLEALDAALDRKGWSQAYACDQAHIDRSNISNWAAGKYRPRNRDMLQRLAQVLDCPELVELLDPHELKRVVVTCPVCGKERKYRPGDLKSMLDNSPGNSANIDWEIGVGTYRCGGCAPKASVKENLRNFHPDKSQNYKSLKDGSRGLAAYYRDQGERLVASTIPEKRDAGYRRYLEDRRGQPLTEEHRMNVSAGLFGANPIPKSREFGLCRLCRLLLEGQKRGYPTEVHMKCLRKWQSENKTGFEGPNKYPPRGRGRRVSSDHLALSYEICNRHLLGGESIRQLVTDLYQVDLMTSYMRRIKVDPLIQTTIRSN